MKKWDFIIIVFLIIISLIPEGIILFKRSKHYSETYAEITVSGKLYKEINLSDHKGEESFQIKTDLGYNIIKVENNKISIIDADCKDKVCIKEGTINMPGQTIACLPHKLVIEIKGSNKSKVDILAN
ncbi:MAG: hypothetical protein K0R54_407 [Clostridiaceae bacterium]|jgi:hypothetical protein|nr:hypothetical protein [Clostridiaceae bacterium]